MGIVRGFFKTIGAATAALAGIAAALMLFFGLTVAEVEDSSMLPELEPGEKVLVLRCNTGDFASPSVGDIVLYETPYYEIGEKGSLMLRRITGINGDRVELRCDAGIDSERTETIKKERILGKVIYHG